MDRGTIRTNKRQLLGVIIFAIGGMLFLDSYVYATVNLYLLDQTIFQFSDKLLPTSGVIFQYPWALVSVFSFLSLIPLALGLWMIFSSVLAGSQVRTQERESAAR